MTTADIVLLIIEMLKNIMINICLKRNKKKTNVYKNVANLYNKLLTICFNGYNSIKNVKRWIKNMILVIKGYKFKVSYKKDEEKSKSQPEKTIAERVKLRRQIADDEDLPEMLLLKVDEEVREGTGLKLLNPKKLLTILPMLLA